MTRAGRARTPYTTDDYTNYHMTFAAEDLEQILEIEADRFMNLKYSESDFRTEARAILGEYNKSSSEPLSKLIEVQREHAYNTHTYQHTTMGFLRDIEDMPNQFEYSRTFFNRWYRPEYTTIIIAGDVDPEAVLPMVEKYWSGWRRGHVHGRNSGGGAARARAVTVHHDWPAPTLPLLTVAVHGPGFLPTDREYVALDALLDISFGETSDLYRELVEEEQKVDQFFPFFGGNQTRARDRRRTSERARPMSRTSATGSSPNSAGRRTPPSTPKKLADVKSYNRYAFARTLDDSESIASTLARSPATNATTTP